MNGDLARIDGFDDAIVGMADEYLGEPRLVYDVAVMVRILMTRDECTEEEAYEWITYNVVCTLGDVNMPILMIMGNSDDFDHKSPF